VSNALAIAGVTAVLKNLLDNAVIDGSLTSAMGGPVTVTTLPPDRAFRPEAIEENRVNLFLFQITHNPGWRNVGLPSRDPDGVRVSNAPLALDLHYLLSVNGAQEFQSEILLGYAMQLLHERPVLGRAAILETLQSGSPVSAAGVLPPAYASLAAAQLAEQVEQIKIVPQYLSTEEMSRFWSSFQTNYRMTVVYQVSVILIERAGGAKTPLPVLTRGPGDSGISAQADLIARFPALDGVVPPTRQPAARLGESVILHGRNLAGTGLQVRLQSPRLADAVLIPPLPGATADRVSFELPNRPADLPAGAYHVSLELQRTGESYPRTTNSLALLVAPRITSPLPLAVARDGAGDVAINLSVSPEVRPSQRTTLIMGEREVEAAPHPSQTSSLSFPVTRAAPGDHFLRVRIDGVESLLVNRSVRPPAFDATQRVAVT
jgi:hypothetical protein